MESDKHVNRRRFFREGLRELLKPLGDAVEPIVQAARQFEEMSASHSIGGSKSTRTTPIKLDVWLRPPGALSDQAFRETCSRCGVCVSVCPAQCIKIDPTGKIGHGAPYIDATVMPCVVCDSLACMNDCPSGALLPTPRVEIDMGTAVWREGLCVRSKGESCTICVDHCPMGEVAIKLVEGEVQVNPLGCIGCGVCEHDCPTTPKSIVVIPKAAREG